MTRVVLLVLLLAGCATSPAPRVETVKVMVPTPVACIDASKVPAEPPLIGPLPSDARQAADLLGATLSDTRRTIRELLALIGPCTK